VALTDLKMPSNGSAAGGGGTLDAVVLLERDSVLETLDDLLGDAGWRHGRLVLLRGEAGVGKTAVVDAFTAGRSDLVVWGMCDPVAPPRPLAPLFDIAEQTEAADLLDALRCADRHRIVTAFVGLLRAEDAPRIVVVEDVHWADETTLEVLQVVGRRAAQLRALVIATYRTDDVGPDHPLSVALGEVPTGLVVPVDLAPLSLPSVATLAEGKATDPMALHGATGGNPFYVTEVLASGGDELPPTIRDAVWARVRHLKPEGRAVVEAASVLGPRSAREMLAAVAGVPSAEVDTCVAGGFLRWHQGMVEFRNELSRRAVLEALTASRRSRLHSRSLELLRASAAPIDAGELARHAVEADDAEAVREFAPEAGARAAALGAHRASLAHYESALRCSGGLPDRARALLLEAHAHECFILDLLDRAVSSQREAVACLARGGDGGGEGRALINLAEYQWWQGDGVAAQGAAADALERLASVPADVGTAGAYARLAQISIMSGRHRTARDWGMRAVALAESFGDEGVVVHALNSLGVAEVALGDDGGWDKLESSLRRSLAADREEDAARAFNNLLATSREQRRYDRFDLHHQQAEAFFDEHDLIASQRCLVGDVVDGLLERGRWREAGDRAHQVIERGSVHGRVQCLAVLGRLDARRGEGDPFRWLDEALVLQDRLGGEASYPLRAARAEAAWLAGDSDAASAEISAAVAAFDAYSSPWLLGETALWAHTLGVDWTPPRPPATPFRLEIEGRWTDAADAWSDLGCPYDAGRALASADDEVSLRRALDSFLSLGATPMVGSVRARLRAMGARRITRGPRPTTRTNPAGLSDREVDVLGLVAAGMRNAEIAERLVLSIRTVDHHVSAILTKLEVRSRYDAGRRAGELGITPGVRATPERSTRTREAP
jgi:DNA-binding CsgD family transcriptional regulator/tetratricopeptide (TPR) repeat protein